MRSHSVPDAPAARALPPARAMSSRLRAGGVPAGAATPTIPPADEIGDELAVGSSAIGQGEVQATALTMATVAAMIAMRGRRPHLTLSADARAPRRRRASRARVSPRSSSG
jgi:cell division protein FtsI/penicillin-binding protein 2